MSDLLQALQDEALLLDYRNLGATGLKRYAGLIREDFLPQLDGQNGVGVYKEMGENDSTCAGILYAIDKLVRRVDWRVNEASSAPFDKEAADFLETCMHDMSMTWIEHIAEFMSMVQYGHSFHEIVYKRRCGDALDKSMRSKYSDGRIGWRYMPIRSQDTIFRWHFDASGDIVAMEQLAPPNYVFTVIPLEKGILFRTTSHKNNPEGRSIFRGAYRSWYFKSRLENIEAVGAERDICGLPVAFVPPDIMVDSASDGAKKLYASIKNIVTNIKNDEQGSIVFPMAYDKDGNKQFDIQLMASAGTKQFDTDKIIQRYDQRIAMSVLFDFLLMGQSSSSTGSFAMHTDKTKMAIMAIEAFLDIIAAEMNNHVIPRLFRLNAFPISEYPTLSHAGVEHVDLVELGDYISKLTTAGMPMFPNAELTKYLCEVANMPPPPDLEAAGDVDEQVEQPPDADEHLDATELHDTPPSATTTRPKVAPEDLAQQYPTLRTAEQFGGRIPSAPVGAKRAAAKPPGAASA